MSLSLPRLRVRAVAALALILAIGGVGLLERSGAPHRRPAPPVAGPIVGPPPLVRTAALVPDPEAAHSYPVSAATPAHAPAESPRQAALNPVPTRSPTGTEVARGAPSDAEVRRELSQMHAALKAQQAGTGVGAGGGGLGSLGTAQAPAGAPAVIARIMAGGNAIADFPYRFGGGHGSFVDNAYDCSGSVSYALAGGGLVGAPLTSGDLMSWGAPGPGRWLTVFANPGHTYMYVAGLRFDTSGRSGPLGSRWQAAVRDNGGFVARHWPGL